MPKQEIPFENFLSDIGPEYAEAVCGLNGFLLENGCKAKLQLAKSGHVVSYTDAKKGHTIANFVSRKKGPVIRIYGNSSGEYIDFIASLPDKMIKAIEKAPVCKRLLDPAKCNQRCPMGYTLAIKDETHKKCRYSCFMFEINDENYPHIKTFLEKEIEKRA